MPMFLLKGFLREGSLACLYTHSLTQSSHRRRVPRCGEALSFLLFSPGFLFLEGCAPFTMLTEWAMLPGRNIYSLPQSTGGHIILIPKNLEFVGGQVASSLKGMFPTLSFTHGDKLEESQTDEKYSLHDIVSLHSS